MSSKERHIIWQIEIVAELELDGAAIAAREMLAIFKQSAGVSPPRRDHFLQSGRAFLHSPVHSWNPPA